MVLGGCVGACNLEFGAKPLCIGSSLALRFFLLGFLGSFRDSTIWAQIGSFLNTVGSDYDCYLDTLDTS